MTYRPLQGHRPAPLSSLRILLTTAALACGATAALANDAVTDGPWTASDGFAGSLRAGSREMPVEPGDRTSLLVRGMPAGAEITVMRGTEVLTDTPAVVGENGSVVIPLQVPAEAAFGHQPLTVISANPAGVAVTDLKLSQVIAPMNEEGFAMERAEVGERAYQAALSQDGKLFVTSARGKDAPSSLLRLDATTLAEEASAEIATDDAGKLIEVFGVAVDDAHGQVWTTNTKSQTVTVYDAETLQPVKVFPEGSVGHPRDVVVDQATGRAYVNDALSNKIEVYDTASLEHLDTLRFETPDGKGYFATMTLDLDADQGRLYSVSKEAGWAGWIDLKTGESHVFDVPGLLSGSGIAHDPETGRMFVTGQDSDNVIVLDEAGTVLADTTIGAGGLSVVRDPATGHIYAAARAAGTVSVLDEDGTLLANLPAGDLPNELTAGPDAVYLVTMNGAQGDEDATGTVTRITPAE